MPGDLQTSAGWVQRVTWYNGTVPVGACAPWCAVLPLIPNCSGFYCIFIGLGSLYIPICTQRGKSNCCLFCNWIFSLVSVTEIWWGIGVSVKGKLSEKFSPPRSDGKCYCRQPAELREEEIPALSWFGYWPKVSPHKMFKEVLEYLSKRRLRTMFSAAPSCVCSMTQGVSWGQGVLPFNFIRGKAVRQDPDSSVYCSISVFYLLFFSPKVPRFTFSLQTNAPWIFYFTLMGLMQTSQSSCSVSTGLVLLLRWLPEGASNGMIETKNRFI